MDINHGPAWLMFGDCLQRFKDVPDNSVDLVLCDPPYGTTRNKWDSVIPLTLMWGEIRRVLKDDGAAVFTAAQPFTSVLITSNPGMFKYTMVWDKLNPTGFLNAKKQPLRRTEDIVVFYSKQATYNPVMETRGKPRGKGGYNKPGGVR